MNFFNFKDYSIINEFDFTILKRDESSTGKPSDSFKLKLYNEFFSYLIKDDLSIQNKLTLNNFYSDYYFNNNQLLSHDLLKVLLLFHQIYNLTRLELHLLKLNLLYL